MAAGRRMTLLKTARLIKVMFDELIAKLTVYLAVATAFTGLWRYRLLAPTVRFIALLVCFDAATEVTAGILRSLAIPNLFLYPVSLGGEALLLTLAYRRILSLPRLNRPLLVLLAAYLAFTLIEAWAKLGTVQYFVAVQVVSNLLMLGLAALYFQKLLNELQAQSLRHDPFFWVSVGLAIYALGNLLIVLSSDYIRAHYSTAMQRLVQHGVRNFFNIELYAAYLVALLLRPAPRPAA